MPICLPDTNILLRYSDPNHALYPVIRKALHSLSQQGFTFKACPQNFTEFWNVATRPLDRNGLGLSPVVVQQKLASLEQIFPALLDVPEIYAEWKKIVIAHSVSGVQVHDARLAAIMQVHGINHILTFNFRDFTRYATIGIVAFDPNML